MAKSKHHKNHKQKVQQFKQKVMTENTQNQIPKTHLIPQPEWQSDDILEVRGDLLEVIDQALVQAYSGLQKAGNAYQQIIANNIEAKKAKLNYVWNNGQPATEQEVTEYKAHIEKIQELRKKQMEEAAAAEAAGVPEKEQQPGAAVALTDEAVEAIADESRAAADIA